MDKDFIKSNKLDEAVERFRQIADYESPKQSLHKLYEKRHRLNEYTFITEPMVNEDGDENDGDLENQNNMADDGQALNTAMDSPQQNGDMDAQNGNGMQPDMQQMPQNGMPQDNNMGNVGQGDGSEGEMGELDEPEIADDGIETEEMEAGDEVVDVDDLTQSQEATEYKLDGVDDRLSKIYAVVQKFSDKLDKNEESIMALKDEFEKRNPTQTEKFNLRSQASGPFNQSPSEYWDKLSKENPNYDIIRDNDVSPSDEQKKYDIKRSDISGLNMKSISDTLDVKQNLNDYLNF